MGDWEEGSGGTAVADASAEPEEWIGHEIEFVDVDGLVATRQGAKPDFWRGSLYRLYSMRVHSELAIEEDALAAVNDFQAETLRRMGYTYLGRFKERVYPASTSYYAFVDLVQTTLIEFQTEDQKYWLITYFDDCSVVVTLSHAPAQPLVKTHDYIVQVGTASLNHDLKLHQVQVGAKVAAGCRPVAIKNMDDLIVVKDFHMRFLFNRPLAQEMVMHLFLIGTLPVSLLILVMIWLYM